MSWILRSEGNLIELKAGCDLPGGHRVTPLGANHCDTRSGSTASRSRDAAVFLYSPSYGRWFLIHAVKWNGEGQRTVGVSSFIRHAQLNRSGKL